MTDYAWKGSQPLQTVTFTDKLALPFQQTLIELLLRARHCSSCWGVQKYEINQRPCPQGAPIPVGHKHGHK